MANSQGNFFLPDSDYENLKSNVVFEYCSENGVKTNESNPNGSSNNIAGISNKNGNVLGMMPHPERSMEQVVGCSDGRKIFESVISWLESK